MDDKILIQLAEPHLQGLKFVLVEYLKQREWLKSVWNNRILIEAQFCLKKYLAFDLDGTKAFIKMFLSYYLA